MKDRDIRASRKPVEDLSAVYHAAMIAYNADPTEANAAAARNAAIAVHETEAAHHQRIGYLGSGPGQWRRSNRGNRR